MRKLILLLFLALPLFCHAQKAEQAILIADSLCKEKDYQQALDVINNALGQNNQSDSLYYYRGLIKTNYLGDHSNAFADFKKTIELNPKFTYGYYGLGKVNMELDRNDEAIAYFTQALDLDPDFVEAYYSIGLIHYNNGKGENKKEYKMALDFFNKAIKHDKDNLLTSTYTIIYLERSIANFYLEKYKNAATDLETYFSNSDNPDPEASYYAGFTYYYLKNYNLSLEYLGMYLYQDSLNTDALYCGALSSFNSGMYEETTYYLLKYLAQDSTNSDAYLLMAQATENIFSYEDGIVHAYKYYTKAASLGNQDAQKKLIKIKESFKPYSYSKYNIAFSLPPDWLCDGFSDDPSISQCNGILINGNNNINIAILNDSGNIDSPDLCGVWEHTFSSNGKTESFNTKYYPWECRIYSELWNETTTIVHTLKTKNINNVKIYIWANPESMELYKPFIDDFINSIHAK
jgi:tetratricopeptide (TPR) repeat protein